MRRNWVLVVLLAIITILSVAAVVDWREEQRNRRPVAAGVWCATNGEAITITLMQMATMIIGEDGREQLAPVAELDGQVEFERGVGLPVTGTVAPAGEVVLDTTGTASSQMHLDGMLDEEVLWIRLVDEEGDYSDPIHFEPCRGSTGG